MTEKGLQGDLLHGEAGEDVTVAEGSSSNDASSSSSLCDDASSASTSSTSFCCSSSSSGISATAAAPLAAIDENATQEAPEELAMDLNKHLCQDSGETQQEKIVDRDRELPVNGDVEGAEGGSNGNLGQKRFVPRTATDVQCHGHGAVNEDSGIKDINEKGSGNQSSLREGLQQNLSEARGDSEKSPQSAMCRGCEEGCPSCDIEGTSKFLMRYFEDCRVKKAKFYKEQKRRQLRQRREREKKKVNKKGPCGEMERAVGVQRVLRKRVGGSEEAENGSDERSNVDGLSVVTGGVVEGEVDNCYNSFVAALLREAYASSSAISLSSVGKEKVAEFKKSEFRDDLLERIFRDALADVVRSSAPSQSSSSSSSRGKREDLKIHDETYAMDSSSIKEAATAVTKISETTKSSSSFRGKGNDGPASLSHGDDGPHREAEVSKTKLEQDKQSPSPPGWKAGTGLARPSTTATLRSEDTKLNRTEFEKNSDQKCSCSTAVDGDIDNDEDGPLIADASLLVGKPIRLYCPVDNSYHVGRIIDWRRSSVNNRDDEDKHAEGGNNAFSGSGRSRDDREKTVLDEYRAMPRFEAKASDAASADGKGMKISEAEYLVRFRAGVDGRGVAVHQWMVLEEHAVAVAVCLVWGYVGCDALRGRSSSSDNKNDDDDCWRPGQIMARTALEMVPVREVNAPLLVSSSSSLSSSSSSSQTFGLCLFFGEQFHAILRLRDGCAGFSATSMAERLKGRSVTAQGGEEHDPDHSKALSDKAVEGPGRSRPLPPLGRSLALPIAMACVECEAERRVRMWHGLPGKDKIDKMATGAVMGMFRKNRMVNNEENRVRHNSRCERKRIRRLGKGFGKRRQECWQPRPFSDDDEDDGSDCDEDDYNKDKGHKEVEERARDSSSRADFSRKRSGYGNCCGNVASVVEGVHVVTPSSLKATEVISSTEAAVVWSIPSMEDDSICPL